MTALPPPTIETGKEPIAMLADLIVSRSALGADRGRDDLHRHATFSCGLHAMLRRVIHLFKAA